MKQYKFYQLKEEIAVQYYQSEGKLYRLFVEYERAYHWAKPVIEKQIRYITEPLPTSKWLSNIQAECKSLTSNVETNVEKGFIYLPEYSVDIQITSSHIELKHDSKESIEWQLFDILKKLSPLLFAFQTDRPTYGWLKPLRVYSVLT